ncbi:MAG: putative integral rane protein [Solirubrobacteraceae bacterium]|jgi:uncharacterized membrane protein|nr:putative integral rane protein [Solirubrobacteraceae bacterium]
MFTLYTLLLTLHILAVAAWMGSAVTQQLLAVQLGRTQVYSDQINWFSTKWFPAISGITALFGILLWIDGPWDFGEPWILIAVVLWLVSAGTGATQLGRRVEKWAGREPDQKTWDEFRLIARIDLVVLVLVVFDMVMKPG